MVGDVKYRHCFTDLFVLQECTILAHRRLICHGLVQADRADAQRHAVLSFAVGCNSPAADIAVPTPDEHVKGCNHAMFVVPWGSCRCCITTVLQL